MKQPQNKADLCWHEKQDDLPDTQISCIVSIRHYPMSATIGGGPSEKEDEIALATFIPPYKEDAKPIFLTHSTSEDMNNVLFNDGKITESDGRVSAEIIAWMPLPEPCAAE